MPEKNVLRTVDDAARRQARGLIRAARFGALAVLDPQSGAPQASRVSLAAGADGAPIFLISRLSGHFGALEADPRAALLVGEPGRGDPLAHPRISVSGRARMLEGPARQAARDRFLRYHPKAALYADFADFAFWRLEPGGASLNGGFGKAYEMAPDDLLTPLPEGFAQTEADAVAHMIEDHGDAIKAYAEGLLALEGGGWTLAGLDPEGLDLARGDALARHWFDTALTETAQIRPCLVALARRARAAAAEGQADPQGG